MADYVIIVNRWLYFFFTNLFKCSVLPHGAILPHLPLFILYVVGLQQVSKPNIYTDI